MKKFFAYLLVLSVSCAACVCFGSQGSYVLTSVANTERQTIIIDAGHGGFDGGAVANDGTVEKDINLSIALVLADFLKQAGYQVVLTRQDDTGTDDVSSESIAVRKKSDLVNRVALTKEYPNSIYVSIHLNKFTTSAASGAQVFYSINNEDSAVLAQNIQDTIINLLQNENTRVIKKGTSSTYLLENSFVPTVIVECGFLSNSRDLKLLKTEEYQKQTAFCIYLGISRYFSDKQ